MSEPLLLPIKPGSLSLEDKQALREVGVIVIEHDNPAELRLLRPTVDLDSSALLRCALRALTKRNQYQSGALQREAFTEAVAAALADEFQEDKS